MFSVFDIWLRQTPTYPCSATNLENEGWQDRARETKEHHLPKLTLLNLLSPHSSLNVMRCSFRPSSKIEFRHTGIPFNSHAEWNVCIFGGHCRSGGAFCQHFKVMCVCVCVCVCQLGGHFLLTGQSRLWEPGRRKEDGTEAWRCSSLTDTRDHTTRQQTLSLPPSHLLTCHFFLSLHLSAYLFPSASESGNRNLKAASSFHILSALPLIALDTPTAFTWLNRLKASFLSVCVFWVGLFSCHLHRTYDAGS